jgi:hypothetical protein
MTQQQPMTQQQLMTQEPQGMTGMFQNMSGLLSGQMNQFQNNMPVQECVNEGGPIDVPVVSLSHSLYYYASVTGGSLKFCS